MRPQRATETFQDVSLLGEWTAVFRRVSGGAGHVSREQFKRCLQVRDDYLAERIFDLFDVDGNGSLELGEFLGVLGELLLGGEEAKLRFAFRLHDSDGSGAIDKEELARLVQAALRESELAFSPEQTELLVTALFRRADHNGDGQITFEELSATFKAYPELCEQMTLGAAAWLAPLKGKPARAPRASRRKRPAAYYQLTSNAVWFLIAYAAANLALFVEATLRYADHNVMVMIARGCGACLNFNGAVILLPMLRHFLTWLRKTPLERALPVDHAIAFHKLVGHWMFVLALVHTAAHLGNYTTLERSLTASLFDTWAGATGVGLLLVFALMWTLSRSSVRRRGGFRLFYYSHYAFVVWFLLALLHGPVFWQWASLPLAGYGLERLWRLYQGKNPSYVVQSKVLPHGVTHLQINRPASFDFQPGDYMFVLIPAISRFEWHPFTISSPPEEAGTLSVHVRSLGNWTNALHAECARRESASVFEPLEVFLDGPYGTPSTAVFGARHAVLIAAGIGVTPFASILQSILHRRRAGELSSLASVDFYWLNRGQYSFDWLTDVLRRIENEDEGGLIGVNIYLTNAKVDLKSTTLSIAMNLSHQSTGRDLITGLRCRTRLGRPNFAEIFAGLAQRYAGDPVSVFYCGPYALSGELKREAEHHGFAYRKENF